MLGYEGALYVKRLLTREAPQEILKEDFPSRQWPISGGWGYSKEDAVVIELDNERDGVAMEYTFLEYRSYEEGIIFLPHEERLEGFRFERGLQALHQDDDGRMYDRVTMTVFAFTEQDWEWLKNDWKQHDCYMDDKEGRRRHEALRKEKMMRYEIVGWFDISRFFGR